MRVDKYIWSIRILKTRSLATKTCKSNYVKVNDELVKPSRELKIGDIVSVRKEAIWYTFKVLDFPKGRVGAKLVAQYSEDQTSAEELQKLDILRTRVKHERPKGLGRPTKKDRRDLDDFSASWDDWDLEDDD
ncbi:MAG: RNA-binding protein [Crocinitomicaceae bacterium]|nr:RNA-binding protein [Crocinitomicaceae bacterium]|tara:strand:- start:710 stop:1105 length:396 start_codon:yes stop_codon:yes gene_type:complete